MSKRVAESLRQMNDGVKTAFATVKAEMNEHLDAINQNTGEIQACHDYLAELDARIAKIEERIDNIQFALEPELEQAHDIQLTPNEEEVFLVLYAGDDPVTLTDIAKRLGLSMSQAEQYLVSMVHKGIPVLRTFHQGSIYHSLELKFKDLQARKNILNISSDLTQQLVQERTI